MFMFAIVVFLYGCSCLPLRPGSDFYKDNVKKIQLRFLNYDFHSEGYYADNNAFVDRDRAMRDGRDLYENKLKDIIRNKLEAKGYKVEFAEPLDLDITAGFWWGCPCASDANALYSELLPKLKSINKTDDTDAILIFTVRFLQYRWEEGDYTSPDVDYGYSSDYSSPRLFETGDMTNLDINYQLYSLNSQRRILANDLRNQRKSEVVSEQNLGYSKIIRWVYAETEDEFLERCISQLASNIPEYGKKTNKELQ